MREIREVIIPAVLTGAALMVIFGTASWVIFHSSDKEPSIDPSIERCEKMGGIPIRSIWGGRLAECIFPPKE